MTSGTNEKLTEHIALFEHHVNENLFEIHRRLEELIKFQNRTKENFLDVERKLVEIDQHAGAGGIGKLAEGLHNVSKIEEKVKALEDMLMLLEMEVVKTKERQSIPQSASELDITPQIPTVYEDKIKTLEEKMKMIEKLKLKVPVELIQHEPRLKSIEENIFTVQKNLDEEVKNLEKMISSRSVSEPAAEHFVKEMREEMNELRREIDKAELLKHEILAKEREFATRPDLESFEKRVQREIGTIHDLTDRIAAAERSLDTKLIDIEDKLETNMHEFQNDLKKEVVAKIENQNKNISKEIEAHRKEMEAHAESYTGTEDALRAEIETQKRMSDKKIAEIESTLRKDYAGNHDMLNKKIAEVDSLLRKESASIESSLNTKIDATKKSLSDQIGNIDSVMRRDFDIHRRSFDNKLVDIEENATKIATEVAVRESRKDVETALASHKKEVNEVIGEIDAELAHIKPILTAEKVASLMERINTIERDLESHATAIVTRELSAFSEAIDRKFPDLITKADFMEWSHAVAQRIQTIETPDMSPLAIRIDKLEMRLEELTMLMREIATRMPIVVE